MKGSLRREGESDPVVRGLGLTPVLPTTERADELILGQWDKNGLLIVDLSQRSSWATVVCNISWCVKPAKKYKTGFLATTYVSI